MGWPYMGPINAEVSWIRDVMDTLVKDPFFSAVPSFFGLTLAQLLDEKHPDSWIRFEKGEIINCNCPDMLDRTDTAPDQRVGAATNGLFNKRVVIKPVHAPGQMGQIMFTPLLTIADDIDAGLFLNPNGDPGRIIHCEFPCVTIQCPDTALPVTVIGFQFGFGLGPVEPGSFRHTADDGGGEGFCHDQAELLRAKGICSGPEPS